MPIDKIAFRRRRARSPARCWLLTGTWSRGSQGMDYWLTPRDSNAIPLVKPLIRLASSPPRGQSGRHDYRNDHRPTREGRRLVSRVIPCWAWR